MNPLIYGKLPPQNIELEAAVLGAILLEPDCLISVSEIIQTPEVFYKFEHQLIFEAIQATVKAGSRVDLVSVTDRLRKLESLDKVGGVYGLTSLTVNVVTSAHVIQHANDILHYWKCREIIRISGEALTEAYEPDAQPSKISEGLMREMSDVVDSGTNDSTTQIGVVAGECLETAIKGMNNPGTLTGVDTGLQETNRITNGWQRQSVNILAARPSQGKTALALILALNANVPVLVFSLEMGKHELTNRMLASISGVPLESIQRGTMSESDLSKVYNARADLGGKKILIDDKAGLTTANFLARVRKWKRKFGVGLVIVDYLQLMQVPDSRSKNREAQVSEISRSLKLAAKEMDIPVIALSQMNREFEKGGKRKPQLSDLRESGAIEQDADIVMFIWHEEDACSGRIKNNLVFAKNRNGRVETVELQFIGATQRWENYGHVEAQYEQFNPYAGITPKVYTEDEPF